MEYYRLCKLEKMNGKMEQNNTKKCTINKRWIACYERFKTSLYVDKSSFVVKWLSRPFVILACVIGAVPSTSMTINPVYTET